MSTHHKPPIALSPTKCINPIKMIITANIRLIREATSVAQCKSPFIHHSNERNIRPPSVGNAGSKLNIATNKLITERYHKTATTGTPNPKISAACCKTLKRTASRKLAMGPAMAMKNSIFGVLGSSFISATPPKMKSVMPSISSPYFRAMREWENSWIRMETKRPIAPTKPMIQ